MIPEQKRAHAKGVRNIMRLLECSLSQAIMIYWCDSNDKQREEWRSV